MSACKRRHNGSLGQVSLIWRHNHYIYPSRVSAKEKNKNSHFSEIIRLGTGLQSALQEGTNSDFSTTSGDDVDLHSLWLLDAYRMGTGLRSLQFGWKNSENFGLMPQRYSLRCNKEGLGSLSWHIVMISIYLMNSPHSDTHCLSIDNVST